MADFESMLKQLLTPELCLAVYKLKFPGPKKSAEGLIGRRHFRPEYFHAFYELVYHQVLIPLSTHKLETLLAFDWKKLLPEPTASDYPEKACGLVTILDQQRGLTAGYGRRWTCAFFDPICEKLARSLVALPEDLRPDGKQAWISRGYSVEDWLVRTLWFWAPLVHSDRFMVNDRQQLKDYLHEIRAEAEASSGHSDPLASWEAKDDIDITAFPTIESDGPPLRSYFEGEADPSVADYAFWWIRILNAHFAWTDKCGHYAYWIRYRGGDWNEQDREAMKATNYYRYSPDDEPLLKQIKKDENSGVWQPLEPNPAYEETQ